MINFRFHLVSLVGVFLALAVGVIMGSTVIDRAIVDGLRNQIQDVKDSADQRRAENLELESRVEGLEAYAEQAGPLLLADRLTKVAVAVVAVRGVDGDAVRRTVEALREGAATVPGVLWLEPSLALAEPAEQAKLREVLGNPFHQGDDLRRLALDSLGARLASAPASPAGEAPAGTSPTAVAAPSDGDLLARLAGAGFVGFETLGGVDVDLAAWPVPGARLLVVDGPEADLDSATGVLRLVRAASASGVAVALGEVSRSESREQAPGGAVRSVREDDDLADRVATIDGLEGFRGRTAVVLALDELGRGAVGHYGKAPAATRQLPAPATAATTTGTPHP